MDTRGLCADLSNGWAERAILGAIFVSDTAIELVEALRGHHFSDPINAYLFDVARKIYLSRRRADVVTVSAELASAGKLDECGGNAYLATLLTNMVAITVVPQYAEIVIDLWTRRSARDIAQQLAATAEITGGAAARDIVLDAVDQLISLADISNDARSDDLSAAIDAVLLSAEQAASGSSRAQGLQTGISSIDRLWRGLWPGMLDILAARSEHGKTAFGLQTARHVAEQIVTTSGKNRVLIFSLEMSRSDIALRMLATETGIPSDDIRAGTFSLEAASRLVVARQHLKSLPIMIRDKRGMTLADIKAEATVAVKTKDVNLIIIDHLHRIAADQDVRGDDYRRVSHATEQLKNLAGTLDVPILLLAQASRQTERRDDPRPRVSDIKYAGEADADNVILLWRPELYASDAPPKGAIRSPEAEAEWWARVESQKGKAEVIFAKRRFGPVGSVWVGFDGPRTRFFDLSLSNSPDASAPRGWNDE